MATRGGERTTHHRPDLAMTFADAFADAFAENVRRSREKPAIVTAAQTLTYRELDRMADDIARELRAAGATKGEVIWAGTSDPMRRSAALVAAARVGAALAVVPLNASPKFRDWAINVLQPIATLADRGVSEPDEPSGSRPEAPSYWTQGRDVQPDDPFVITSTSGTTGHGKLVAQSHVNRLHSPLHDPEFVIQPHDVVASFGALHLAPVANGLAVGATVVLPGTVRLDTFLATARRARANSILAPTAFLRIWAAAPPPRPSLEGIDLVGVNGSRLPEAAARALEHETGARVLQRYGSTEAVIAARQPRSGRTPLRSVGQPPPGVRVWLRDSTDGGASEILVAGPNVSLGYWGEPPRDPSAPFATGDAGHIESTGDIYVHGRIREVIDVAGRKVAPWIVAEAVAQHPSVTECAVFGTDDAIRGQRVAAAVVGSAPIDRRALRAHCRARLEPHEVPRDWVFLDEIPLSSGGKPDLAALQRATSKSKTAHKPR